MHTLEPILAEHPFLKGLRQEHLALLVGCASNVRFEAGAFVFRQGQEANHFFILRDGKVAVEAFAPQKGAVAIDTYGEGDVLGWSWLLPPYRWRFDARAVEPTRMISLDARCMRTKCENDHDLGYELMKRFAGIIEQRLDATRWQLLDLYGVRD
ncbi:MAG: cyclic nucleotide-binding domain-containing protein [Acidobacteria bacterium]|nr:cyclic nucleotide-binding domain-containing protein [Acidobacteriota bacterium]